MNRVIERATAHYRNRISGEMRSIDVPEWETRIYFKTVSTLRDEGRIVELSQQGKTVEALVESILLRARNEDGSRMFTAADKPTLLNEVDPAVIIRIAGEINQATATESLETAEKN